MEYKHNNNCFYVVDNNEKKIAEMTFTRIGNNQATIDDTFVEPAYRGQGIADKLLTLVVEQLKQEGRNITPICSFAIKKLHKNIV